MQLIMTFHIVVNKASGRPGAGYMAITTEEIHEVHKKVYAHDWTSEQNPF